MGRKVGEFESRGDRLVAQKLESLKVGATGWSPKSWKVEKLKNNLFLIWDFGFLISVFQ